MVNSASLLEPLIRNSRLATEGPMNCTRAWLPLFTRPRAPSGPMVFWASTRMLPVVWDVLKVVTVPELASTPKPNSLASPVLTPLM